MPPLRTQTTFVPGGAASGDTTLTRFPQLETTLSIVQASLNHRIRPNLGYALRYWFESWDEENFASDFNQPYMGDPNNDPGSDRAIYLVRERANQAVYFPSHNQEFRARVEGLGVSNVLRYREELDQAYRRLTEQRIRALRELNLP